MTQRSTPTGATPDAARYEIRLGGHLDPRWATWFDGITVEHEPDGTTALRGEVADQAALHGVLQRARDLGLPLISVRRLDDVDPIDPFDSDSRKDDQ
jgi:hypothetical protein